MSAAKKLRNEDEDSRSMDASEDGGNEYSREKWSGKLDFILSCVGYAVGLSNIWRFPYLCYRSGGGAFLIPYVLFLVLCGIPLIMMEMSLGQFASLSPTSIYGNFCPLFQGLGWSMVIVSGVVCIYYNVIIAWTIYYLVQTFQKTLPWMTCDGWWNTNRCVLSVGDLVDKNATLDNVTDYFNATDDFSQLTNVTNITRRTASDEFWQFYVLRISNGLEDLGDIQWQLLICLIVAWICVYLCLCKGVKSSGRVVYVTATFPYVVLFIFMCRGLSLPGAMKGIRFYLVPQWDKLLHLSVWLDAASQIFYSIGAAWGAMITLASYNKFNHNCYRDAILIPIINCGTSFFAGLVVFSIIGFMAEASGIEIDQVITSGPGLAFIVYPEAISMLPGSHLWAVLFFVMLLTIGLDSQFGMFETLVSAFIDAFPGKLHKYKLQFTAVVVVVLFLVGIPCVTQGGMFIFTLMDWYSGTYTVMFIAMVECLLICWNYGYKRYLADFHLMTNRTLSWWWPLCWGFITPAIIACLLFLTFFYSVPASYNNYKFPPFGIGLGWCMAGVSMIPIPFFMIYNFAKAKGNAWQRLKSVMTPTPEWGPTGMRDRIAYRKSFRTVPSKQQFVSGIDGDHFDDLEMTDYRCDPCSSTRMSSMPTEQTLASDPNLLPMGKYPTLQFCADAFGDTAPPPYVAFSTDN